MGISDGLLSTHASSLYLQANGGEPGVPVYVTEQIM